METGRVGLPDKTTIKQDEIIKGEIEWIYNADLEPHNNVVVFMTATHQHTLLLMAVC